MDDRQIGELLQFFKALADPNRLKIVGLLAGQDLSVEQLAAMLDLQPSTVSHHLSRLSKAGLVSARAESYYNIYSLRTETLQTLSERLLAQETLEAVAAGADLDAYDRKVIRTFVGADGRIKQFPSQFKKMKALLHYVVEVFEPGKDYTEKQVNALLSQFNDDTATLRRELVEQKLLAREGGGGKYWRISQEA
ncbi:MAG: metalloregulator ArsR/SmtB family transcription factor [Anaerolineae bacterium]|nr:metalloregulator ArsR/SmtB family transcription factor [Anaerolineae bacterium]